MAEKNTADIGFEKQIWNAACVLRGNMDASEYKGVVLGLIFLKYISDRFEDKYNQLVADGDGFEEDRDEYTSEGIFFVPAGARWSDVSAKAHDPEIGQVIDDAMRAIEKENARLKDILPKNFARPELDKRRLGEVVDLFTNIKMIEHGSEKDILGRTYEYCLSMFAEQEGKRGGEFFTPSCVVRTLVEVLQPFKGRVYDPCCGSGGMFVQSAKFVENHSGNINDISIYGQDSNPTTWKLAQMNLAIRGIEPDLGKYAADTFLDDQHPTMRADYIMANPPFNLSNWGAEQLKDDVRWQYGMPPASNANFAWLQHMIYHLAPGGRMGMVLANTALSIGSDGENNDEYAIRKSIIEDNLVEAIVSLPAQLFYSTKIKVSIWFLSNRKHRSDVLFIDARNLGHMVNRTMKEFDTKDIRRIADCIHHFQKGMDNLDESNFCKVATIDEIRTKKYNISPSKYVLGSTDADSIGEYSEEISNDLKELERIQKKMRSEVKYNEYSIQFQGCAFDSIFDKISQLDEAEAYELLCQADKVKTYRLMAEQKTKEIADRLFKYWFIDFNYPNEEGSPFKLSGGIMKKTTYGEIPNAWSVIAMGDLLYVSNEKVGEQKEIPEYSTTNQGLFLRAKKFNKVLTQNSSKNKLIIRGDIVFGMSREIFNFGVMKEERGSVSPAYHVYHINDNIMNPEFLEIYMRICSEYFLSLIKPGAREGQVLDKEELKRKIILCPPKELQDKYMLIRNHSMEWFS